MLSDDVTGALLAYYFISKSKLPNTYSVHALEQAQILAGQFTTGTGNFSLGKEGKPVHISSFGYMTKMH